MRRQMAMLHLGRGDALTAALELTDEQVDDLFRTAMQIEA